MIFLLLSILSSTCIYLLFKWFVTKQVNTRQAILVNYAVACAFGIAISGERIFIDGSGLPAVALGVFFYLIFLTMAKTAQLNGVSVAAVANKMSVVIPVSAAVFLYGESIGWSKWLGLGLAVPAIVLVSMRGKTEWKNFLFPIVLFLGSGAIDTVLKWFQHHHLEGSDFAGFSAMVFLGAFLAALAHHFGQGKVKIPYRDIQWGTLLGLVNFGAIFFILKSLDVPGWESSIVFPVNHTATVLLSALAGSVFFREHLGIWNWTGIVLAVIGILVMMA